jgi:TolB-like protein
LTGTGESYIIIGCIKEGYEMKKNFIPMIILGFLPFFAIICCVSSPATQTIFLDQAIQIASDNIGNSMEKGVKIAILNFSSPSEQFSGYVLDELSGNLVNGKKIIVVDRNELDLIRREENFQMSGEVSDESARAIGKKLGAQMIVSGSLTAMGRTYRFRIKTLNVETAAIEVFSSFDISAKEEKVIYLLAGKKPSSEITPVISEIPQSIEVGSINLSWSGPWIQSGQNKYICNNIGDGQETWETLTINAPDKGCSITVKLTASSESDCDYGYASTVDGRKSNSGYQFSVTGSQSRTFTYNVPSGTHNIYFGYKKDGSVFSGNDNVAIEIITVN